MNEMIAFCGLACNECPAFLATQANDDEKRAEVARTWSRHYKADIKPEDINCSGCQSESGVFFGHCFKCEIRKCAREAGIANCARCDDYACEKLAPLLKMMPEVKARLDNIRG